MAEIDGQTHAEARLVMPDEGGFTCQIAAAIEHPAASPKQRRWVSRGLARKRQSPGRKVGGIGRAILGDLVVPWRGDFRTYISCGGVREAMRGRGLRVAPQAKTACVRSPALPSGYGRS